MKDFKNISSKDMQKKVENLIKSNALDTDIISARLDLIMSNDELLKKALIASGIYDKNLKLTKHYR